MTLPWGHRLTMPKSLQRWHLHTDPHEFETPNGRAKDWGHWLRIADLPWRWWHRVLAWNPCNNIGQLYDCPAPPPKVPVKIPSRNRALDDRETFIYHNVIPQDIDNISDDDVVADGIIDMWRREEMALTEYRRLRSRRRGVNLRNMRRGVK